MAEKRTIDRAAWARVIRQVMAERAKNKVTPLGRFLEVNPRTITRWLDEDVNVDPDSVCDVARKIGTSPILLLAEVGYFSPQEVSGGVELDEEEEMVLRADVDEATKERALEQLHLMRVRDKKRRMEDLQFLLNRPNNVG